MRLLFIIVTLSFIVPSVFAQNIDSTLARYASEYGQEKIYLHYDKPAYAPGETVWFKAYLMEGLFPAEASKTFYADWTDEQGRLLYRTISPVVDGTTNGHFDIPAEFKGKAVHVKAYTKWMLNFDTAFIYQYNIRILNTSGAPPARMPAAVPELRFFPEGGNIITGVANRVAFKASDQWGQPVKIKGVVVDKSGKVMDSLRVVHDGMGSFFIAPKQGDVFTAKWKDEKGKDYTTPLPAAKAEGVALQLAWSGNKNIFSVLAPSAANPGTIHVLGTMNQQMVFKTTRDISSGEVKGTIPADQLPSGILTISVFDSKWVPLAERIVFINNGEYLFAPAFRVQHWGLNKRARNEIEISVPDSMLASLSVAVTDAGIGSDSSNNVIAHLMLAADLRGHVHNPAYYFRDHSPQVQQHLDLVMMTHGWRRFKWDEVAKGKFPTIKYQRDTAYLTLSGRVYGAMPSELMDAGDIILIAKSQKKGDKDADSGGGILVVPVKPDGTFNDPNTVLFDSTQIYYQFQKGKGLKNATVKFLENKLPPFSQNQKARPDLFNPFDTVGNWRHTLLAGEAAELFRQYEGKMLEEVVVKSKGKSPIDMMDEKYSSGSFAMGEAYKFDLVNDPSAIAAMNIFSFLQGRVAGLQINNASGGNPSMSWRGGTPQLYLNEMITDVSMISSIPASDIAFVKVFRPPFMGGAGGGSGGAIAIYTRRGDDAKSVPGQGLPKDVVMGYTELREFYSPNYASFRPENDRRDLRTTLYWNPQVIAVPGNNKIRLTFYNNDVTQAFRVIIQGMTKDGRLAFLEETME